MGRRLLYDEFSGVHAHRARETHGSRSGRYEFDDVFSGFELFSYAHRRNGELARAAERRLGVDDEADFRIGANLDDGRRISAAVLRHPHFLGLELRRVDWSGRSGFGGSKGEERIPVRNVEQRKGENDDSREFEKPLRGFAFEKGRESADGKKSGSGAEREEGHGHRAHHETAGAYGIDLHGESESARQEERESSGGHSAHRTGRVGTEVFPKEFRERYRHVAQTGRETGKAEAEKEHEDAHGDRYESDEEVGKPDERAERAQKAAEKSESENSPDIEENVRFETRPTALVGVLRVPFRADAEDESANEGHAARNAGGKADEKRYGERGCREVADFSKRESEMPREVIEREDRECRNEYEFVFRSVALEPGEVLFVFKGIAVFGNDRFHGLPVRRLRVVVRHFHGPFGLARGNVLDAVELGDGFFEQDFAGLAVHARYGDGVFSHGKKVRIWEVPLPLVQFANFRTDSYCIGVAPLRTDGFLRRGRNSGCCRILKSFNARFYEKVRIRRVSGFGIGCFVRSRSHRGIFGNRSFRTVGFSVLNGRIVTKDRIRGHFRMGVDHLHAEHVPSMNRRHVGREAECPEGKIGDEFFHYREETPNTRTSSSMNSCFSSGFQSERRCAAHESRCPVRTIAFALLRKPSAALTCWATSTQ